VKKEGKIREKIGQESEKEVGKWKIMRGSVTVTQ
jgi:hypothetical protein